tara:strand:- start:5 stop:454 length:450 start_codon:yes stop_codon:yes gene_type:complete
MYYNDEYFVEYYNDPQFAQPHNRLSKHAIQRKKERLPKTHIGETTKNIVVHNTVVTTVIKKPKVIIPIEDKLKYYNYYNKIKITNIGRFIGKKGANVKTLKYKVQCITNDNDFEYHVDKDTNNVYILTNNKKTLLIATNELNSNITYYM